MKEDQITRGMTVIYSGLYAVVIEKSINNVKIQLVTDEGNRICVVSYQEISLA